MFNLNSTQTVAKTRLLAFALVVSLLAGSGSAVSCEVNEASSQFVARINKLKAASDELVRESIRMYRFYKLVSDRPMHQARAAQ